MQAQAHCNDMVALAQTRIPNISALPQDTALLILSLFFWLLATDLLTASLLYLVFLKL